MFLLESADIYAGLVNPGVHPWSLQATEVIQEDVNSFWGSDGISWFFVIPVSKSYWEDKEHPDFIHSYFPLHN